MRRPRHAFVVLLIFGLAGFAVPAITMAAGGGSAGDQQYTDPFGASSGGRGTTKAAATPTAPTPAASAPAATAPPPGPPAATAPGTTSTPTAVAATNGTTGKTLPFTGYDGRLAVLLGAGLVLGGAALRTRLRRS
ncbi:MAG: hypothetical protein ABI355_07460 [Solirubrobacteraceae bacterium]